MSVAVLVAFLGACSRGGGSPSGLAADLALRVAGPDRTDRFVVDYAAGGTHVLDCFLPNREFSVAVDRISGVLVVSEGGAQPPDAVLTGEFVYLNSGLFAGDALGAAWLQVPADVEGEAAGVIRSALGGGMAGYLFAGGLPPNGAETAAASLEVAQEVTAVGPEVVDGRALDGFRLRINPEELGGEAAEPAPPGLAEIGAPLVDVWFDAQDRVARIVVSTGAAATSDAPAEGWSLDYADLLRPLDGTPPNDVVALGDIDPAQLRAAAPATCELGSTGE